MQGKVALLTGGSRGLGRAVALALAAEGARVAVNARRSLDLCEELVQHIHRKHGVAAQAVGGDISRTEEVHRIFDEAERGLGPLDILINNAGTWPRSYVAEMTDEEWDQTVAVNLRGPFLTCREAVRRWLAAGRPGSIVNISSQAAFYGATSGHAHYAAAKAGLVNFTMSLAREVARRGIRVNGVAPGLMKTDMTAKVLETEAARYMARIPLGRVAEPEEVAAAIVFLASPRASYMTGTTVCVTGGMIMR